MSPTLLIQGRGREDLKPAANDVVSAPLRKGICMKMIGGHFAITSGICLGRLGRERRTLRQALAMAS